MNLVWATRGHTWGFRFLLDRGYSDPLPAYERAFGQTEGDSTTCRHVGSHVALRFPDPQGRRDAAGRTIPHDVVVLPPMASEIHSVEEGQRLIWPLLADAFAICGTCLSRPHQTKSRRLSGPSEVTSGRPTLPSIFHSRRPASRLCSQRSCHRSTEHPASDDPVMSSKQIHDALLRNRPERRLRALFTGTSARRQKAGDRRPDSR